jgi:hypothetical protein
LRQEQNMTIDQVTYLADGLSVTGSEGPLALERTRVSTGRDGVDVSFRIAGTDFAPRMHLSLAQLSSSTVDEMASLLRRLATRVAG